MDLIQFTSVFLLNIIVPVARKIYDNSWIIEYVYSKPIKMVWTIHSGKKLILWQ